MQSQYKIRRVRTHCTTDTYAHTHTARTHTLTHIFCRSPLFLEVAVKRRLSVNVIAKAVALGADVNVRHPNTGKTPLFIALMYGYSEIVKVRKLSCALRPVQLKNSQMTHAPITYILCTNYRCYWSLAPTRTSKTTLVTQWRC